MGFDLFIVSRTPSILAKVHSFLNEIMKKSCVKFNPPAKYSRLWIISCKPGKYLSKSLGKGFIRQIHWVEYGFTDAFKIRTANLFNESKLRKQICIKLTFILFEEVPKSTGWITSLSSRGRSLRPLYGGGGGGGLGIPYPFNFFLKYSISP